ncbi:hypothetical protein E2C01_038341 [Portunus trituberculatus]|uniref:Uncharacterized protein n=1 Tax=Portunus trituberculatus TaxID=210409 RepID=A0A5B7FJY1_PORTR|nr:hypothetical protein [Portunus trituberculatus]
MKASSRIEMPVCADMKRSQGGEEVPGYTDLELERRMCEFSLVRVKRICRLGRSKRGRCVCSEVDGEKGYVCVGKQKGGGGRDRSRIQGEGSREVGLVKGDGGLFIGKGTTEQKIRFPILKLELLGFSFRSITVTKRLRLAHCTLSLPHIPHAPPMPPLPPPQRHIPHPYSLKHTQWRPQGQELGAR